MRASYVFGAAVLVMAGFVHAAAQGGRCSLNVGQSPQLRGLRLGMSVAQVRARYPRLPPMRADEFGQVKATFGGLRDVDEAAFEGVNNIVLNFVDDRLVAFGVGYENAPWDDMDQFLERVRESLKLPGGWTGEGYGPRRLSCDGFQIEAGASVYSVHWMSPYIRLWEPGAEDVVTRRAAEKRERQRQAFKP